MWSFPANGSNVNSWTSNTKPHGWFDQVQMLRTFSQAMDIDLPMPTSSSGRLSKLASYACVQSTTAPRYKSCVHPYDRIVQSVNGFGSVSETRMQLQPAPESHE
jgi:hypothetical protein